VQHCDDDVLALVALGEEPTHADAAHLDACPQCQAEVESLRRLVSTVRVPVPDGTAVPPPQRVWDEIAAATGVSVAPRSVGQRSSSDPVPITPAAGTPIPPAPPQDGGSPLRGRRRAAGGSSRRSLLAVAASALVVGAVGGSVGSALLRSEPPAPKPTVVTQVVLAALPVDPSAKGEAQVVSTGNGRELAVDVSRLTSTTGLYEVWLIDRGVKKMIPLGILHGSKGEFVIPPGVDLGQYPIIDVSEEPLDGNPQHSGKSLLRGTISG